MNKFIEEFSSCLKCAEGAIAIETSEPVEVIEDLKSYVNSVNEAAEGDITSQIYMVTFDSVKGLRDINGIGVAAQASNPEMEALGISSNDTAEDIGTAIKLFTDIAEERVMRLDDDESLPEDTMRQLLVLKYFDRQLMPGGSPAQADSNLMAAVDYLRNYGRASNVCCVMLVAPGATLPDELAEYVATVEHDLPSKDEREGIIQDLSSPYEAKFGITTEQISDAVRVTSGLSRTWTERVTAKVLTEHKSLDTSRISSMKADHLRKGGLLDLWTPGLDDKENFFNYENLIGLNGLKKFVTNGSRENVPDRAKLKGILLVGVPGTGKSFFMRCTASELRTSLSEMSTANLYSKWVGETDKNLKKMLTTVEHIGGILGIDEYQRFMPTGGQDEGRTTQSVAGGMLTWQNNQNSVLVLAAANDISSIPPEFTRSGRFDTTFFVGFPSREAKDAAWEMYRKIHELPEQKIPKDDYWTPADISVCCKMAEQQGVSLVDAAKFIKICYSGTGKKVIDDLMDWAENAGCLDAETGELFVPPKKQKAKAASRKTKAPKRTVRNLS